MTVAVRRSRRRAAYASTSARTRAKSRIAATRPAAIEPSRRTRRIRITFDFTRAKSRTRAVTPVRRRRGKERSGLCKIFSLIFLSLRMRQAFHRVFESLQAPGRPHESASVSLRRLRQNVSSNIVASLSPSHRSRARSDVSSSQRRYDDDEGGRNRRNAARDVADVVVVVVIPIRAALVERLSI